MKQNIWMSFSDLMSCLMIIFMFISISYIRQAIKIERAKTAELNSKNIELENKKRELERINLKRKKILTDYQDTKSLIYNELRSAFEDKFEQWDMEIGKDLIIRFSNPQVLFERGKATITPSFHKILQDFIPKYLAILLQDKYKSRIKEIRIEGHTDLTPIGSNDKDPYLSNMKLSHDRSLNVLKSIRELPYYQNLKNEQKELLQYWFTANGLSYSHAIDDNKKDIFLTKKTINSNFSRRVEFRVITTSEELIENMLEAINAGTL